MADRPRLWEVEHPYYCSESNWYAPGGPRPYDEPPHDHAEFESWADFGWKDSDPDLNLLFRWDWEVPDPDDYADGEPVLSERLMLFWMLQRKGRFMITSFPVTRDEEPEIHKWLKTRFDHLLKVWAPFTPSPPSPTTEEGDG